MMVGFGAGEKEPRRREDREGDAENCGCVWRPDLDDNSIAVARRLRYDEEHNILGGSIEYLMHFSGCDFEALQRGKGGDGGRRLNRQGARENKKELACANVAVADFRCGRRHAFLNHAQVGGPGQVPTVALLAPSIMFRVRAADHEPFQ
jgi:hypothetical protein